MLDPIFTLRTTGDFVPGDPGRVLRAGRHGAGAATGRRPHDVGDRWPVLRVEEAGHRQRPKRETAC
jgi:hypothetical protein